MPLTFEKGPELRVPVRVIEGREMKTDTLCGRVWCHQYSDGKRRVVTLRSAPVDDPDPFARDENIR